METQPTATTCYRHPDRATGVRCQRCERPICPACMVQASVGFHCPACVKANPQKVVRARDALRVNPVVTKVLIGVNVAAYVAVVLAGGGRGMMDLPASDLSAELVLVGQGDQGHYASYGDLPFWVPDPIGVAEGEWWRLVTGGFLHAGLFHLGMNMLLLWLLGQMLEPVLGRARFLALYVASLLAGSMGVMLIDPTEVTVGASGAIFGLMGAAVVLQRSRGVNPWQSGLGGLIALNLLITFAVPGISIGGHLGGLVGGLLAGLAVFEIEKRTDRAAPAVAVCVLLTIAFAATAVWASMQDEALLGFLSFWT